MHVSDQSIPYRVGVPVVGRTVFRLPINQSEHLTFLSFVLKIPVWWRRAAVLPAYIGCPEILTEWKKPKGRSLSPDQKEWNLLLQFYRARNEHLIATLKQIRASLTQKWRGSYSMLAPRYC